VGFVLVAVARGTGRAVRRVAREPYELTLWTYLRLGELDRLDHVARRLERFDLAALVRLAVMEPKVLADAEQAFRRELEDGPRPTRAPDLAARLREYDELLRRGTWSSRKPVH